MTSIQRMNEQIHIARHFALSYSGSLVTFYRVSDLLVIVLLVSDIYDFDVTPIILCKNRY